MEFHGSSHNSAAPPPGKEEHLRRGAWTVDEDLLLMNYIAVHGEGRWNSLARCSGLKRTGKSCRLRWLNYLRPGVRRGNMTPEEQLLILELHSRWGNRWSKIARELPGRTDNEIKNYWRTKVQKHAKQLQCEVTSKEFKDMITYLWMPRLLERIRETSMRLNAASVPPPAVPLTGELAQASTGTENLNNAASCSADSFAVGELQGDEDLVCDWFELEYSHFGAACSPAFLPSAGCGDGGGLGLLDFGRSAAGWAETPENTCSAENMWLQQQWLL